MALREVYGFLDRAFFDFWLCVQLIYCSIISDLSSLGVSITVQREKGIDPVAETSCLQFYFKHGQCSKSKNKWYPK